MFSPAMPTKGQDKPQTGDLREFTREARSAFTQLQDAVRRIIASTPLAGPRATDLARTFDLDYALAWQIHALAAQPDLHMTARAVPKPGAMERFLLASSRLASEPLARSARTAYEEFQRVVTDLAGDRDTFDAMLTLQRPQDAAGLRRVRRAAHRANAAVWGVSCQCAIRTLVFRSRPTGEQDSLAISGRVGMQRLYAAAPISIVASTRTWGGSFLAPGANPKITIADCELIESACSRPLPRVVRAPDSEGSLRDHLTFDGIGKRAEATFFWRNVSLDVQGGISTPPHGTSVRCVIATELLLVDMLIPRDWMENPKVRAWMTPDSTRMNVPDPGGLYHLPFEGDGEYLGTSLGALHSPAAPQYADVVHNELASRGWTDTEFNIFRCEVQYPVLHSAVHLCIE